MPMSLDYLFTDLVFGSYEPQHISRVSFLDWQPGRSRYSVDLQSQPDYEVDSHVSPLDFSSPFDNVFHITTDSALLPESSTPLTQADSLPVEKQEYDYIPSVWNPSNTIIEYLELNYTSLGNINNNNLIF